MDNLTSRWLNLPEKVVGTDRSPFGATAEGLQDFRGICISGESETRPLILWNRRFDQCDFSYATFKNCVISKCLFAGCKLHSTDLSSAPFFNTSTPACDMKQVLWWKPNSVTLTWTEYLQAAAKPLTAEFVHACHIDEIDIEKLETGVLFYHGAWSSRSVAAFSAIATRLSRLPSPAHLFVLNADDYDRVLPSHRIKLQKLFGAKHVGANGETCWFVNGHIVAQDVVRSAVLVDERVRQYFA